MDKERKTSLYLVLALLVFFGAYKVSGQTQKKCAVALKVLNVLSSPSPDSSPVYIAQPGEKMDILDDLGTWLKVKARNGAVGFVQAHLVRVEIIIQGTPPAPKPQVKPSGPSSGAQPVVSRPHRRIWPYLLGGAAVAGGAAYLLFRKGGILNKGTATLRISSNPSGAEVFLDGSSRCTTPCTIENVEPGKHSLKIVKELFGEWEKEMEIKGYQDYEIEAKLSPYKYEFVKCVGGSGGGSRSFDRPAEVAIGPSGKVYVADGDNRRIQVLSRHGDFLYSKVIGSYIWGIKYYGNSRFITSTSTANAVIYFLNLSLSVVGQFTTSYSSYCIGSNKNGRILMANPWENRVFVFNSSGSLLKSVAMKDPVEAEGSPNGDIYVSLHYDQKIGIFSSSLEKKAEFSSQDADPWSIAFDRDGNVYVSDYSWGHICKFTPDGSVYSCFGGSQYQSSLWGIDVFDNGDVVVVDHMRNKVCFWTMGSETASSGSARITVKRKRNSGMGGNKGKYEVKGRFTPAKERWRIKRLRK